MVTVLERSTWPWLLERTVRPTYTCSDLGLPGSEKQCAAVNTLSGSIKLPSQSPSPCVVLNTRSAMKGYLPSGTSVPPTILGLTEAEGRSSATRAAPPPCTNMVKATTIAVTSAATRVVRKGALTNLFDVMICPPLLSIAEPGSWDLGLLVLASAPCGSVRSSA